MPAHGQAPYWVGAFIYIRKAVWNCLRPVPARRLPAGLGRIGSLNPRCQKEAQCRKECLSAAKPAFGEQPSSHSVKGADYLFRPTAAGRLRRVQDEHCATTDPAAWISASLRVPKYFAGAEQRRDAVGAIAGTALEVVDRRENRRTLGRRDLSQGSECQRPLRGTSPVRLLLTCMICPPSTGHAGAHIIAPPARLHAGAVLSVIQWWRQEISLCAPIASEAFR